MSDVAFLVYLPMKERRADNSFDGNTNIGAFVIADALTRSGISVEYCSPETAHKFRVVLVSMTSTLDAFAFYRAVALLPIWQREKRPFTVIAGGFGMQNPIPVRNFIDFAAFGRAHEWVSSICDCVLGGGVPSHPSVMNLPDIAPVVISQSESLYPHEVNGRKEAFTGCPLKCKFCHYSWARRPVGCGDSYVQNMTTGQTPELTWHGMMKVGHKMGRVRVAIDGFSQRLRYAYGKRISNADIVAGVEHAGSFEGTTVLLIYNICNMPTETHVDREELYDTFKKCKPKNRVVCVLQHTPFRPSPATPMQWEPAALFPDWSKLREGVICETESLRVVHSWTLETPYSHLISLVAERATIDSDKLFHAIVFSPALKKGLSAARLATAQKHFDISQYVREYNIDEPPPTWWLQSYTPTNVLQSIAHKMRRGAA